MIARLVLVRLVSAAVTLLIISAIVFVTVEALPGDVATSVLGQFASDTARQALREQLNLDMPAVERYFIWLGNILHGELGESLGSRRPIGDVLWPRVFNTLMLSGAALLIYLPLAVLPAMAQAVYRGKTVDQAVSVLMLGLASIPDFLLALLLLLLFVVVLPLLPAVSMVNETTTLSGWLRALALPALTLAVVMAVYAQRILRDNLIEVLEAPHVLMARLRGLPEWRVLWIHAFPNAAVPLLNLTALNITYLAGGVVVVEKVFGFPGFGSLLIDAIRFRDVPLIEVMVLLASSVYVLANLMADVGALLLIPKLRTRSS
jgi:peptide/nickel transport system permease protein